jgi:hypothetical protein
MSNSLTVFQCGLPNDHKCDNAGPAMAGGDDVPTLPEQEVRERGLRGYTWGSVTCSVCGMTAMDQDLWRGHE